MEIEAYLDKYIFDGQFIHFDQALVKDMYIKGCQRSERFTCRLEGDIFYFWTSVPWESNRLKCCVKRLDYIGSPVGNVEKLKVILDHMQDSDLIYMRLNSDSPLSDRMQGNDLGFEAYAQKNMFIWSPGRGDRKGTRNRVCSYKRISLQDKQFQLSHLAENSFRHNRFRRDKRFPPGFYKIVYREWIKQLFKHPEQILCLRENNRILGFLTYDSYKEPLQYGFVNLVAVNRQARGRGVASMLMEKLKELLLEENIHIIYANVDAENTSSLNFFLKNGFKQFGVLKEYHRWK